MASMFARQPDVSTLWKVGMVTLRVLKSHNIIYVNDYKEDYFLPLKPICDYLLLDLYSAASFRPRFDVRTRYPPDPSPESHREFLEQRFVEVYNMFYMRHATHVAFMCVWVYSLEIMLHTVELGLNRKYIRLTGLYLARFLSSPVFKNSCSFDQMIEYARMNVESENRMEHWIQVQQFLRRHRRYRWRARYEYSIDGFMYFVHHG